MSVRCAIYTRKSSDEGLEQAFNSLDAQRLACSAYIQSQASEGWVELPQHYDDGGLSGGTLERPALKRLLANMAAGQVDIVIVYKVDRLSRSLLDFAKLVELFEASATSFVSVTQSFNTTNSMGRLTLNMLLSFAQFEREVTAERIRDKLAASKAKGMWMGGIPPLGYRPNGRTLDVVESHAQIVRHIFARYQVLGNVRALEAELSDNDILVPERTTQTGKTLGGGRFGRRLLYSILNNRIYVGEIPHKERSYPGLHQPIIEHEVFNEIQRRIADNTQGTRSAQRAGSAHLLSGRVFDSEGAPLTPTHSTKLARNESKAERRRYRYYVSQRLQQSRDSEGFRLPADELEGLVIERVSQALETKSTLADQLGIALTPETRRSFGARAAFVAANLRNNNAGPLSLVTRVEVGANLVTIVCNTSELADALGVDLPAGAPPSLTYSTNARLRRSGRALRLFEGDGAPLLDALDLTLIKRVAAGHRWWAELRRGKIGLNELAQREGVTCSYLVRIVRLAFLSPKTLEAILNGRQRAGITISKLTVPGAVPACWRMQERSFVGGSTK